MVAELLSFHTMPRRRWFPALFRRLIRQTHGQDLIEYGVLLAIIAGGVLFAASQLGVKVPGSYVTTNEALPSGVPAAGSPPGRRNPGNGNPGNDKPVGNPGPGGPGGNPGSKGK